MNTNPIHDLAMIRKIALVCAGVTLFVACLMSASFGWSMSALHAFGLGLITIATALIFPYIGHQWNGGSKWFAGGLVPIAVLLCIVEFGTHTGYTNGVRTIETEDTGVKNAAYQIKQDSVARNAATLASLKRDLEDLKGKNQWAASVSADGLRAKLPAMDEAIRQEKARGGCGPRCLKLTNDRADISNQIAVVEKVDGLTQQIATVQGLVNAKETEATSADFKSSEVVAQPAFLAKTFTWSLEPTAGQKEGTQIGVGFAMALATTFLPAVFMLMAFGPAEFVPGHKGRAVSATEKSTDANAALLREIHAMMARPAQASTPVPAIASPSSTDEVHLHITNDKEVQRIKRDLGDLLDNRLLKAA